MTPAHLRRGVDELTAREREMLEAYIDLGKHRLVAEALGISEQTVKNTAADVLKVLEVNSIGQACVLYDRAVR